MKNLVGLETFFGFLISMIGVFSGIKIAGKFTEYLPFNEGVISIIFAVVLVIVFGIANSAKIDRFLYGASAGLVVGFIWLVV